MFIIDIECNKIRMAELQKEARQNDLGHRSLSKKNKTKKAFPINFMSFFTSQQTK
ncbi:hypothetical protein [Sporosarcina sp. NPDC096371]|uniref:hypothetical protein n=1 Tax=Sporosarcina sp. NPDC096371 TaxID=3364530 RepID=UPI003812C3C9